jgi:hypothetical protein
MIRTRLLASAMTAVLVTPTDLLAQGRQLDQILTRLSSYLSTYEERMSAVVAEEAYDQLYEHAVPSSPVQRTEHRSLTSDFVFLTVSGDLAWMGFRDTFAVDGEPVRDRDERLQRILSTGQADALTQAYRIANDNARYNLGGVTRTINVPTFALGLLEAKNRFRFKVRQNGTEAVDGHLLTRLEFRESRRPTIIRGVEGGDQPATVTALVDAESGAVHRTVVEITAARNRSPLTTTITVGYREDPVMGMLVPHDMLESHVSPAVMSLNGFRITGRAVYTNYRRFQTSGRIVR